MLKPTHSLERNFLRRIMRRYRIDFIIIRETIEEGTGNEPEEVRNATSPEIQMWNRLIPEQVRAQIDSVYTEMECSIEARPEELYEALGRGPYTYFNPRDFAVLRANPTKNMEIVIERSALMSGWFASTPGTRIYVSNQIPEGYFLSLEEPDLSLNRKTSRGSHIDRTKLESRLEPLGV
jgi:hypothetical protein